MAAWRAPFEVRAEQPEIRDFGGLAGSQGVYRHPCDPTPVKGGLECVCYIHEDQSGVSFELATSDGQVGRGHA